MNIRLKLVAASLLVTLTTAASLSSVGASSETGARRACAGISEPSGDPRLDARPATSGVTENCLRLNQIQVMGTHNSYRLDTTPGIFAVLRSLDPALATELEYRHAPLAQQFGEQEIRQIELDVFADPDGGLYSRRIALDALGLPNEIPPELLEPGFKVMHIQEIDFNSTCLTFVTCLEQVEAWSDANPRHLPIAVLVELKSEVIPDPLDLGFVTPHPIGPAELDALDAEIRSVFDPRDLITPDDVRGTHPTLESAVLAGNWPRLRHARGKVMLVMDNVGSIRDDYLAGHPSLAGRAIFTNATPGDADAAFVKVNEPRGNETYIRQLVADGYVVRTRSDSPTVEARSGDTAHLEAALASGAQWISTDYPIPGLSAWSDYVAQIPGGEPARCNPVNTGPRCRNPNLERLTR